jgi:Tol biopolymer transport system component
VKISTRRAGTLAAATAVALATVLGGAATGAEVGPPELISAAPDGSAGNGPSLFPSVSEDGRYVAFRSEATNLVPEDTDPDRDVYVRDRQTGAVTLVSRASGAGGAKGNRQSYNPRISANGRFVVFRSNATNFVPEDTDQTEDIYVRDLQTNQTILVSRASTAVGPKGNGASTNAVISGDGRRVAFTSASTNLHPEDTDAIEDVYVRDLQTNETILVSRANTTGLKGLAGSQFPAINGDGTRVAFRSEAPNLHPDDPDTIEDIFLRDLQTGETQLISRASGAGVKGNARSTFVSISADGGTVAFDSQSSNLHPDDPLPDADVFARDLASGEVELISRASGPTGAKGVPGSSEPAVSGNGRYVAFQSAASNLDPDDTDGTLDVYLRDRQTYMTEALSPALEAPYNRSFEAQIAADGSLVAYQADAGTAGSGSSVPPSDVFASAAPKLDRCLGKRTTMVATADDATKGTTGNDVILAAEGGEEIRSGKGNDRVCAGSGDDVVRTAGGRDKVEAGGGADEVIGGGDKDKLDGGGGKDELDGGAGPDKLDGGGGKDRCDGGAGADRLKACEVDEEEKGKGRDRQQGRDLRSPR